MFPKASSVNRSSCVVRYVGILVIGLLAVGISGCKSEKAKAVEIELETADGDLVKVKGPARTVQSLQSKVAELRKWAEDAEKYYERYKNSKDDLESLTADKCVRDIKSSCGEILGICKAVRESSELMAVSSANLLIDDYEAFANRLLDEVRGR